MSATLQLTLLGSWQASLDGVQLPALPTRHTRSLLAYLASQHPRPATRTELQAALFPLASPAAAGHQLRTTLYFLRRVLGASILSKDLSIALHPGLSVHLDSAQFLSLSGADASAAALEAALALYRGSFLVCAGEGWALAEAQRLHDRYISILQRLTLLSRAANRLSLTLDVAQRWVDEEPWEEKAHTALIQAFIEIGDLDGARTQLARTRSLLRSAPVEVSERIEALARMIARLPATQAATTEAIQARTVGQPTRPTLPSPADLPDPERLPLLGRAHEITTLSRAWRQVRQGQSQVLVIEGDTGIGKTRLLREFVAQLRLRSATTVLWGNATETTRQRPLGLLNDALNSGDAATLPALLPTLGTGRSISRTALLRAFAQLAAQQPLVLVLEHIQLADSASLHVITELIRQTPLLVLGSRLPAINGAAQCAPSDVTSSQTVIALEPLDRVAVGKLAQRALNGSVAQELLDWLLQTSAGVPRSVHTLLRSLLKRKALRWEETHGWSLVPDNAALPSSASIPTSRSAGQIEELLENALLQLHLGRASAARQQIDELLAEPQVRQRPDLELTATRGLARVQFAVRDYDPAIALARRCVQRALQLDLPREVVLGQSQLATMLIQLGQYEEGQLLAEAAIVVGRQLDASRYILPLLVDLARIALAKSDLNQARSLLDQAHRLIEPQTPPHHAVYAFAIMLELYLHLGQIEYAHSAMSQAEAWAERGQLHLTPGIEHLIARVWLASGEQARACTAAHAAITRALRPGLGAFMLSTVLWSAGTILRLLGHDTLATAVLAQSHDYFLDDLRRLSDPQRRRALLAASTTHQELAAYHSTTACLIMLPLHNVPSGRPLHPDEQVPVVWTLTSAGNRQEQVRRLVDDAEAQGAVATIDALARVLGTSPRTIQRDLQLLRQQGTRVMTRGTYLRDRQAI